MPGITYPNNSLDRNFPCFDRPAQPCPTSTFQAVVKQVKPSEMTIPERNFLNAAFGGFLTQARPPGDVHALLAATTIHTFHEDRLPRRYDGDQTLPRGRYNTICVNAEGHDDGTLRNELLFYKSARIADAHLEVYDPGFANHREIIGSLGLDQTYRERLVVHVIPFSQNSKSDIPSGFVISIPVELKEISVENVLDLRRPAALNWLYQTIPNLQFILNEKGESRPCFPFRQKLSTFEQILPSLLDQSRGGGNFDKLVGLYLRQIGISGLVFPSVRSDGYTFAVDGESKEFHGWTFLDYRDAPAQKIGAFFELRPYWPQALTLEGGDDNEPKTVAFAEEFQFQMTDNFSTTGGTLAFHGLSKRVEASHIMDSMEAAIRYNFKDIQNDSISSLLAFTVSQGSKNAINFSTMVLYSLLGMKKAQNDLQNFISTQLGNNPIAGILNLCTNPPSLNKDNLAQAAIFHALFTSENT